MQHEFVTPLESYSEFQQTSNMEKITTIANSIRSRRPEVLCKKGVLRNFEKFIGKHLYQSLFFNKVAGLRSATLLKKETLVQVFSCEFCEIAKNTFLHRATLVVASAAYNTSPYIFAEVLDTPLTSRESPRTITMT